LLKRILPFLNWFPMDLKTIKSDLIAGITVALLLIPQSMAYAELAGLPPYYGLYGAFIPVIIGAMFGSLAQLGTGPVAMTSILTAAVLSNYAIPGTVEYIQLAILLALMVGIIRLIFGVFKLAFLFNFVSHPVISGFTNAAAIIIGFSQFNKIFNIHITQKMHIFGDISEFLQLIKSLKQTHLPTLIMGIGAMIIIWFLKRYVPKIPTVLIVVVLATVLSYLIGFEKKLDGVVVGVVPSGLPSFLPIIKNSSDFKYFSQFFLRMIPDALMVCMIGFMEVASVSKTISLKTKATLNLNQELIGQGISAVLGSFFQSYPTSGSFSRSAMNFMSGAKTGFSSVVTGLVVMILLLFFTPLLYHLPKAVLAASIIMAVKQLINWKILRSFWKLNSWDGLIGILTFFCTLVAAPNIVNGIIVGVLVSIIGYLIRTMRPGVTVLGYSDEGIFRNSALHGLQEGHSVVAVRIDGSLYFASMAFVEEKILNIVSKHKDADYLMVDAISINRIDASCALAIVTLVEKLKAAKIEIVFGGVKSSIRSMMEKSGLSLEYIDKRIFRRKKDALSWIKKEMIKNGLETQSEPLLQNIE
jgi:sulfate permease, SulP family